MALQSSDAVLEALLIATVEAALIVLLAVLVALALLVEDGLLVLQHELRESLVDDRLVLVILIEDELGQLRIMVDEFSEREDDVMAAIIDGILGSDQIFLLTIFPPVLDEFREVLLDLVSQLDLGLLVLTFDVHGAKSQTNYNE